MGVTTSRDNVKRHSDPTSERFPSISLTLPHCTHHRLAASCQLAKSVHSSRMDPSQDVGWGRSYGTIPPPSGAFASYAMEPRLNKKRVGGRSFLFLSVLAAIVLVLTALVSQRSAATSIETVESRSAARPPRGTLHFEMPCRTFASRAAQMPIVPLVLCFCVNSSEQ